MGSMLSTWKPPQGRRVGQVRHYSRARQRTDLSGTCRGIRWRGTRGVFYTATWTGIGASIPPGVRAPR
eukprot:1370745-Pyramimonas_sp.AAC.1